MTAPNVEPCDPHPILWGRCPTCGVTLGMTRKMPMGACFSGGAAYAHHVPRNAYTGQPDDSRACMRCGDDVEVGDDEPTRPGGHLHEHLRYAKLTADIPSSQLMILDEDPTATAAPHMRTLHVGGETWVVKA